MIYLLNFNQNNILKSMFIVKSNIKMPKMIKFGFWTQIQNFLSNFSTVDFEKNLFIDLCACQENYEFPLIFNRQDYFTPFAKVHTQNYNI